MGTQPDLRSALESLEPRLRRALRRHGIACALLGGGAIVTLSYVLDRTFEMPFFMRALFLAGFCYFVYRVVKATRRRLRQGRDVRDFVNAVEQYNTDLDGHLANALELPAERDTLEETAHPLEAALLTRALRESRSASRKADVDRALDVRRIRWWFAGAIIAGLAMFLYAADHPREVKLWFARSALLSSQPWPRTTHFELARAEPIWHEARDEAIAVEAWVAGDIPREITLHVVSGESERRHRVLPGAVEPLPRAVAARLIDRVRAGGHDLPGMDVSSRAARGRSASALPELEGMRLLHLLAPGHDDFEIYLSGGDNRSERARVVVHDRPRIEATRFRLTPPRYLGAEERVVENPAGELRIPFGTELEVTARADQPVAGGWIRFGDGEPQTLAAVDDVTISHVFQPETNGFLDLAVREREWGFESRPPLRVTVLVLPDEEPTIRFDLLGANELMTPAGIVRYRVAVEDDHGIARVELRLTSSRGGEPDGGGEETVTRVLDLVPAPVERTARDGTKIERTGGTIEEELALAELELAPGSALVLQAAVTDSDALQGPKTVLSQRETILIIDRATFEEEMAKQRLEAQTRVEGLARREESLAAELEELALGGLGELAGDAPAGEPRPATARAGDGTLVPGTGAAGRDGAGERAVDAREGATSASAARGTSGAAQRASGASSQDGATQGSPAGEPSPGSEASPGDPSTASEASEENEAPSSRSESSDPGDSDSPSPAGGRVGALAAEQNESAAEARDVARDLRDIADAMRRNDLLGEDEETQFREDVTRPLEELADDDLPRSAESLRRAGEARDEASLERAREEVENVARSFQRVADRLAGAADLQEVLGRLELIIELQGRVRAETEKGVER